MWPVASEAGLSQELVWRALHGIFFFGSAGELNLESFELKHTLYLGVTCPAYKFLTTNIFYFLILCVCMCVCMWGVACTCSYVWQPEVSVESVFVSLAFLPPLWA